MTEEINQLVRQAQDGRAEAVGQLYEACVERIHRYLYFATGDAIAAEDLTAQVFLKMVQHLAAYRVRDVSFIAWLFQIARNQAFDHHRRNKLHPRLPLAETHPQPEAHPERQAEVNQQARELVEALSKLPQEQRDVILLRFIDGLPIRDTALSLHRSEDAIKGLQWRALISLRNMLQTGDNSYEPTG